MNVGPSDILERIRAVPPDRRQLLLDRFSRDDAGRTAADVLRLSSGSGDDILLLLPQTGDISGALALAEVLLLPSAAPTIGVLCGTAWTAAPALLQGCTIRVVSRHAVICPRILEDTYAASSLLFGGPEEQRVRAFESFEQGLAAFNRQWDLIIALAARRANLTVDSLLLLLTKKPEYTAAEAVLAGWADAVL